MEILINLIAINPKYDRMRQYYIDAKIDDDAFEYWIQENDHGHTTISELINKLEGSERLVVGDIINFEFDTQRIGFNRNLQKDYNSARFKIDHKLFTYIFLSSHELELIEEYILIPIPRVQKLILKNDENGYK